MNPTAADVNNKALLKNALVALDQMQARLDAVQAARHAPIAVVGMGCRFPGGANDPDAYWQLLIDGVDAVTELPQDRWDIEQFNGPDLPVAWYGGFLDGIDQFDPHFFGISPREAASMDPQQRLVLEVGWEALEHAGQAPDQLVGSQTGVFLGITTNDYGFLLRQGGSAQMDAYAATGGALNAAAGRLAFTLGLQGPTLAVDTACSSSLVAVHLACRSLRSGECDMALAGGVNATLTPEAFVAFARWGMMAPDGRCKTFDTDANGFVRGEGCGIIVLKRLDDALAQGDRVLAVIRGSAVNQDGRSSGLTVPNGPAQQAVLRKALADAGVQPAAIQYVEAHGTGTALGDPIEVEALGAVLGEGRKADQPLVLGSVKTNLGHLESAAGIAGLIKLVLCLQHETIPPHLHFQQRNPTIPWPAFRVEIPVQPQAWPRGATARLGGISGFGFSGTNAHLVLEEAPLPKSTATKIAATKVAASAVERPLHILTASAPNAAALADLAGRYAAQMDAHPADSLPALAHTANTGRAQFGQRLAVVGSDAQAVAARLRAFAEGGDARRTEGVRRGAVARGERPRLAFLFTGQGAQYIGMGCRLYATQPTFRTALDQCVALLDAHLDRPLLSLIFGDQADATTAALLDQTRYTQPALFAVEFALAALWQSWGVQPGALLGHSIGEYAAAVLAGVMSLDDAAALVAARGRLMGALPAGGAMAAVFATPQRVAEALAEIGGCVAVAAVNGPQHVVISGAAAVVEAVRSRLAEDKIESRPLTVSHAFHSPLMEPMLDEFEQIVAGVRLHKPKLRLISNLTGVEAGDEITTPAYWRNHIARPVAFHQGIERLHALGYRHFVEIGPHPVLVGMGQRCLPQDEAGLLWLPSLRQGHDDWEPLLDSLGALYTQGTVVDWRGFDRDYQRVGAINGAALPTYPFQRQRYWLDESAQRSPAAPPASVRPLIDRVTRLPLHQETLFETEFSVQTQPILADHRIYGAVVAPAALQLAMLLNAAEWSFGKQRTLLLQDVVLPQALVLGAGDARTVQAVFTPALSTGQTGAAPSQQVKLFSFPVVKAVDPLPVQSKLAVHATGSVQSDDGPPPAPVKLAAAQQRCTQAVDVAALYADAATAQIELGPSFRWIAEAWRGGDDTAAEALARLAIPPSLSDTRGYVLHPGLLDACFQVTGFTASDAGETLLPFAFDALYCYRPADGDTWWCHVIHTGPMRWDIHLLGGNGEVVALIQGFQVRPAPASAVRSNDLWQQWLYTVEWQPQAREEQGRSNQGLALPGEVQTWLILADRLGVGASLAAQLRSQGARAVLAQAGERWLQVDDDAFEIAADCADDYRRLVSSLPDLQGVLHLWSLDVALPAEAMAAGGDAAYGDGAGLAPTMRHGLDSALLLAQALLQEQVAPAALWLVTQDAQAAAWADRVGGAAQSPLWGLAKVLLQEHPELNPICIDLPAMIGQGPAAVDTNAAQLYAELTTFGRQRDSQGAQERQIVLRADARYVARLQRFTVENQLSIPAGPYRLEVAEHGLLDTLRLRPIKRRAPGRDEIEIEVQASGLNFRDVLNALGAYPGEAGPIGSECAGVVVAVGEGVTRFNVGDSVLAMTAGSFCRYVTVSTHFVAHRPQSLTPVQAASLPTAWLTAYYGLHHVAQIKPGDRVLIHAAAGGVGMAAVQLAQQAGAEVFATAGIGKWQALRSLGVSHIYDSRTIEFAEQILAETGGAGVDVILNSLTGPGFMQANLAVLAADGCLAEMSKRNIWSAQQVAEVRPHVRYTVFDLGETSLQQPALWQEMLAAVMALLESGQVQPLPCTVFPLQNAVQAFRLMQRAWHIGKIVLTMPADVQNGAQQSSLRSDATYLITGGLSGLGLAVAQWLAGEGARRLLLIGRRPPQPEAQAQLAALTQAGVDVRIVQADVADPQQLAAALQQVDVNHPLGGVMHCAGELDDGVLMQQNWNRFAKVLAAKAQGAWNLHLLTSAMHLDFFVLFSSASSLLGSRGQANYVAANAFLDALAHRRRSAGLPALSINWGAWAEIGMAAKLMRMRRPQAAAAGMGVITPQQGMSALRVLLTLNDPQIGVFPVDWAKWRAADPTIAQISLLTNFTTHTVSPVTQLDQPVRLTLTVLQAAAEPERADLLLDYLRGEVAHVLHASPAELNIHEPLTHLGLDSLMALELRNRIDSALHLNLPVVQLLQGPGISDLQGLLMEKLQAAEQLPPAQLLDPAHANREAQPQGPDAGPESELDVEAILAQLDDMSEENLDLLLAKLQSEEGST